MRSAFRRALFVLIAIALQQLPNHQLFAQKQMEIEGDPNSTDTVMTVPVNSTKFFSDVLALSVHSEPTSDCGIGGSFYGGSVGLKAFIKGSGIIGESTSAYGFRGISIGTGFAGYFRGNGGKDIVIDGSIFSNGQGNDEGAIASDSTKSHSDLRLVSNDEVIVQLVENEQESGNLIVLNGENSHILTLDELGKFEISERLMLGGINYGNGGRADEGVITNDPNLDSSDLWLVSHDALVLQLDQDNDESAADHDLLLMLWNDADTRINANFSFMIFKP